MELTVYLAGEIHTNWRDELEEKVKDKKLNINFVSPQTNHDLSDDIGEKILGEQPNNYFRDDAASSINNLRTTVLMQNADIVIARFGDEYKQWNTAMDATTAVNLGKPLILIRPKAHIHPLKELSNKANVVLEEVDQAVEVLEYIYK
ncbi:YtoQ family protein [Nosocomiicoccus ampullae]|uniref:YtoQ family protein n=1 Tax=Nosocomiicoccus ampullae TaxID=489910 RepID=A0A9Q2HEP8_9STAP|nr:YtoQ family protein [Nosocomiicoccus ampullae]MBB5175539.1 YtoQ family protein [Nosocomiicoccus ampullae]QYA46944.1 YtoQ family protein [Nosocomiicoccus ampullae]